ncbi:MAG: peptidase [Gemmatimonadetes bacterium]|nr:peptidase [Gemmatimonadota bacterium]
MTWPTPICHGLAFALMLVVGASARGSCQQRERVPNLDGLASEAAAHLAEYLRINTSNPPGRELEAARFLKTLFEREGIEVMLGAERANVFARLRGNGTERGIALLHHMDVVPADSADWSVPPFGGVIRDGYVYGRGALDMKGDAMVHALAMIALKRSGVPLTRDVVFIGNADEEAGSRGAEIFVARHADLLTNVGFLITEGGFNPAATGVRPPIFGVSVSEKRAVWQRLTVVGTASHGSRPRADNPAARLVTALARLVAYQAPVHVTPAARRYLAAIAPGYEGRQRQWLLDVEHAVHDSAAKEWLLSQPIWNALLRNTMSLTVLQGSVKTNVIPRTATTELDIRVLPDQDVDSILNVLKRVAADSSVHWTDVIAPGLPLGSAWTSLSGSYSTFNPSHDHSA